MFFLEESHTVRQEDQLCSRMSDRINRSRRSPPQIRIKSPSWCRRRLHHLSLHHQNVVHTTERASQCCSAIHVERLRLQCCSLGFWSGDLESRRGASGGRRDSSFVKSAKRADREARSEPASGNSPGGSASGATTSAAAFILDPSGKRSVASNTMATVRKPFSSFGSLPRSRQPLPASKLLDFGTLLPYLDLASSSPRTVPSPGRCPS